MNGSNDLKKIIPQTDDMSVDEKTALIQFREDGLPGIAIATPELTESLFKLYMGGKSYDEISKVTNTHKSVVLHLSDKLGWYNTKMNYLLKITNDMTNKINQAKIETANTMSSLVLALSRFFGKTLDEYLATDNETLIRTLDMKLLSSYYKSVDTLDGIIDVIMDHQEKIKSSQQKAPLVNIQTSNKVRVRKHKNNTIEITDEGDDSDDLIELNEARQVSETLAELAEKKAAQQSDHPINQPKKTNGGKNN